MNPFKEDPVARYIRETGLKYLLPVAETPPQTPVEPSKADEDSLVGVENKDAQKVILPSPEPVVAQVAAGSIWPDCPSQLNWTKEEKNRVYTEKMNKYGYFQKGQDNEP